jgi:hypothetical protein
MLRICDHGHYTKNTFAGFVADKKHQFHKKPKGAPLLSFVFEETQNK